MRSFEDHKSLRTRILRGIVRQLPVCFADTILESLPIVLPIEEHSDRHVLWD